MTFKTLKSKPHRSECPKCKDKPFVLCQCPDTPQIKELSDEEIDDIGREHLTDGDGAIEFARAILKKASKK